MKSLEEVKTWLKTPSHIRIILVKVEGVGNSPSTFYLSSKPFVTSASDSPANTAFDACIVGGVSFNGQLSSDGTANVGFGDIEIDNTKGVKDSWLNYIWTNRNITVYIGDPNWTFNDYYIIFKGMVSDLASRDRNTLNLILVDKSQKLNNPISEQVLATAQADNSEVLVPLTFGECFNVSPVVTNRLPNVLEYQVHNGPIENIIEARDNGVPVSITKDLANGRFTLDQSLYGQLTCSVQGAKVGGVYYNNVPDLIKIIVKNYGPVSARLTDADIDSASFANFPFSAETSVQPVGVYCTSRENLYDICSQLANSIGARLVFNNLGLLQLIKYDIPAPGTSTYTTITAEDIEHNAISIEDKQPVKAATKLAYCKNWTVQESGLANGLPIDHADLFCKEWLYVNNTNASAVTNYSLDTQPEQEDTLLINGAGAALEAARRTALTSTARTVYRVLAYPHLLFINLGDSVRLYNDRFGLSDGDLGTVVSVDKDWLAGRVTIGILV